MSMTVDGLYHAMLKLLKEGKGDHEISVAFRWEGDTVLSNITSWCLNGKTIQLNEEDFDLLLIDEGIKDELHRL